MKAFSVQKNSVFGRFGVANQDIKAGDIVHDEYPFAVGPKPSSKCCCLECFEPIDAISSGSRCENCSWPLCVACKKKSALSFHERECELFKTTRCKFYNLSDPNGVCVQLDCIMPLRVLLKREFDAEIWKNEIEPMEHHRRQRFGTPSWNADNQNVVGYLLQPCKLNQRGFDEEEIQKVIGILEVNAFEGRSPKGYSMRCLFPKIAVVAHSCTPNIFHSIIPSDGYKFHVRATKDIAKGSQLFASYTFTLSGTEERQRHLQQGKFFQCQCERCLDPTELGTNFSSLKCQKCNSGILISSDPLDSYAIWKCNKCLFENAAENVKRLLKTLQDEIDSASSPESLENLLEKYKSILHSNHFIMTAIKNALIDSYGHLKSHLLSQLPDSLLKRKIELCEEVLKLLDVFETGKSRARALLLFELQAPMTLFAHSQHQLGTLKQKAYLRQLERASDLLDESLEILSWEDENVCKPLKLAKVSRKNLDCLIQIVRENLSLRKVWKT